MNTTMFSQKHSLQQPIVISHTFCNLAYNPIIRNNNHHKNCTSLNVKIMNKLAK